MKKFYFASFLLFYILLSEVLFAGIVPVNMAADVGKNFYTERIKEIKSDIQIIDTFRFEESGIPLYYVFNFSCGGFIIVAATDNSFPILGYSYDGKFEQGKEADNFSAWINSYKVQLKRIISDKIPSTPQISSEWNRLKESSFSSEEKTNIKSVDPLLTSKWGQGAYYNEMCPVYQSGSGGHCPAGCVAVAMAQTLYYYKYPINGTGWVTCLSGNGTSSSIVLDNILYNWFEMKDSLSSQNLFMAELIYDCGVAAKTDYSGSGSGTSITSCEDALKHNFKYMSDIENINKADYNDTSWKDVLIQNLDKKMPIIYSGYDTATRVGHAFVCDGYQGTDFFHFNWGWNGSCNGYYYLNNLNPGGNYNFTLWQSIIVNIFPDTVNYSYPMYCSGSTLYSDETMTFDDGSGLVHDYKDNSDCEWKITSNENVKIKLDFLTFDTEKDKDKLYIYDGENSAAALLGCFSGNTLPPSLTSTGNNLYLRFITNDSVHATGWITRYTHIYPDYCRDTTYYMDAREEYFDDGSGKYNYYNNLDNKWIIELPSIYNITVTFDSLDTERHNDLIYIYDMQYKSPVLLQTLSGKGNKIVEKFSSNHIMLNFKTDYQDNAAGWKAHYTSDFILGQNDELYNFSCFPNPATDYVNIFFEINRQTHLTIDISDISGTPYYFEELNKFSGIYTKTFEPGFFRKGIYIIKLITGSGEIVRKFEKL
jgi:hypothetical protein